MKPTKKNINGILLLDKPLHMTSNGALQRVKHLFNAKKAGHTGSLDPLASGMLPICFGEATKFSQFLLESDKTYEVSATLGRKTSTGDAEGAIIAERPVNELSLSHIENILRRFEGAILQVPPMFSALKYKGKPLYELARQGKVIERDARPVTIYDLKIIDYSNPILQLQVYCSKGTYIRTLVEDIGDALGPGAYVSALRRTWVNPYQTGELLSLSLLEQSAQESGAGALQAFLLPMESAVQGFPAVQLTSAATADLLHGKAITCLAQEAPWVRLYTEGARFIGVGEVLEGARIFPRRLINNTEI